MSQQFIKYNILRVLRENLEATIHFYSKICGMKYVAKVVNTTELPYKWEDNILHIFYYQKSSSCSYSLTGVCFLVDNNFNVRYKNQGYWKIGLGLRDVNAAVSVFQKNGYDVGEGGQFLDVGFLTSMTDPNGHCIELLQHDFEKNFQPPEDKMGILNQPVLIPPVIGQITIRCSDPVKTREFYTEILGMKLVCIEHPGKSMPFVLYFFAYTDENPPNSDLNAVENREWLYRQNFCQIEIQHRLSGGNVFQYTTNDDNSHGSKLGHVGFSLVVSSLQMEKIQRFVDNKNQVGNDKGNLFVHDPDGYLIEISQIAQ